MRRLQFPPRTEAEGNEHDVLPSPQKARFYSRKFNITDLHLRSPARNLSKKGRYKMGMLQEIYRDFF